MIFIFELSLFINRAYAEEKATSYAAHGVELVALLGFGTYAAISVKSKMQSEKNLIHYDTESAKTLNFLSKTYPCTKTMTEKLAYTVIQNDCTKININ